MNKICTKCGLQPALSYHPYCYTCLRIARGQPAVPKFLRDPSNKTLCSKCKKRPRAKSHNYCNECRNECVKQWAKEKGGYWKWITSDPERHKRYLARKMVYNRVYRGQVVKGVCEVCGNPEVQAHHDDYDKPLEVRWLCLDHHPEADKKKESLDAQKKMG